VCSVPFSKKNLYSGHYVIMPLDLCVFILYTVKKYNESYLKILKQFYFSVAISKLK